MTCITCVSGAATFRRYSRRHRTDAPMEESLVFDSLSITEVQPDEAVPLLRHSSIPLSRQNFEMASVHKSNRQVCFSDTFKVSAIQDSSRFSGINPSLDMDAEECYFHTRSRGKFSLLTC